MKGHVYYHIPFFFRLEKSGEETPYSNVLRQARVDALKRLADGVLLEPGSTLDDLVKFVNDWWNLSRAVISPEIKREVNNTIRMQGWPEVAFISLNPVNFPAVFLHWRILAFLFGSLTGYDQRRFVALEQEVPPPPEDIVPEPPTVMFSVKRGWALWSG